MKFLIDENVHSAIYHFLKNQGFDVKSIAFDYPSIEDIDVLTLALREERIIITNDKDFGYLAYYQKILHKGIILFRLKTERPESKIKRLQALLQQKIDVTSAFVVITEERIRVRSKTYDKFQ